MFWGGKGEWFGAILKCESIQYKENYYNACIVQAYNMYTTYFNSPLGLSGFVQENFSFPSSVMLIGFRKVAFNTYAIFWPMHVSCSLLAIACFM